MRALLALFALLFAGGAIAESALEWIFERVLVGAILLAGVVGGAWWLFERCWS